jgi:hypothetical protein
VSFMGGVGRIDHEGSAVVPSPGSRFELEGNDLRIAGVGHTDTGNITVFTCCRSGSWSHRQRGPAAQVEKGAVQNLGRGANGCEPLRSPT